MHLLVIDTPNAACIRLLSPSSFPFLLLQAIQIITKCVICPGVNIVWVMDRSRFFLYWALLNIYSCWCNVCFCMELHFYRLRVWLNFFFCCLLHQFVQNDFLTLLFTDQLESILFRLQPVCLLFDNLAFN